ncbi:MAG: AAA family ATPase [Lachnospiraceae bacterium]|nr:AAA family ATPase [Lachnospiraceae bacterium]
MLKHIYIKLFYGGLKITKQVSLSEIVNFEKSLFKDKTTVKPNYELKGIEEILHRNEEIRIFYEYMKDIFREIPVSPGNIFIYGKPGLGKTIITKWCMTEVIKLADIQNKELCVININCEKIKSEHAVLQILNEQIPVPEGEKRKSIGNSLSKNNKYFTHLVDNYNGIIIVVFDELDKATNPEMINNIIRTSSELTGQYPCVVCITNNLNLIDTFPPHLQNALGKQELIINPYDAEQLQDILNARVKTAFKPNTIEKMVVPLCAAFAAQENGDARKAIELLRVAGEIAEAKGNPNVVEQDVREAKDKIELNKIIEAVKKLPTQHKIALLACIYVFNSGRECNMKNIYTIYERLCEYIDADILTQRRISDLLKELDQLGIIEGENFWKGKYGRKKIITKIAFQSLIKETLFQDNRLEPFADVSPSKFFFFLGSIMKK